MKTAFRWIGAAFGLLVFVVLVILAWGTGLPVYHIVTCSARLPAGAHVVASIVADDAGSPAWRSDVSAVSETRAADGTLLLAETDKHGQTMHYRETVSTPTRIVRVIDERGAPFGGAWTYRFGRQPDASSTTVAITEAGAIYNPGFRFMERYAIGYTSRIRIYLGDLARKLGDADALVSCGPVTFASPR